MQIQAALQPHMVYILFNTLYYDDKTFEMNRKQLQL